MGKRTQDVLTHLESAQLLTALSNRHLRVYVAARLMLEMGLRINEARQTLWGWFADLDSNAATLTIPKDATKTKWPRTLPVPDDLRADLVRIRDAHGLASQPNLFGEQPLVFNRDGTPPTRRYIQRTIKEASLRAIGRPIRPHTLRHTFATRLLGETNLRVVQIALGHRSIRSTEIYTHPHLRDLRSGMNATRLNRQRETLNQ